MLLFHGAYRRMSESLDELCLATGLSPDGILDPLTGKAFLYEPKGFAASPGGRKVVLLAAPKDEHSTCWGISISQADRSLSAKVVSLPRSAYESLAEGQAPTTGQQVRDENPGS
jgi:hypothetical protein